MFTNEQINLFWSNVSVCGDDECWNWKLSVDRYGYGKVRIGGKIYISHRVAYMIHSNTEIPSSVQVLHSCDNSRCCNPKHLRPGDHLENMKDRVFRNRQSRTRLNVRKMDADKASRLRDDYKRGMSKHALAKKYNISPVHVRGILKGIYWA